MENLILSLNVVLPLFLMMALGYLLRCIGLLDERTLKVMNNVVFRAFLPVMLFYNIYSTELEGALNPSFILYAAGCIVAIFILLFLWIPRVEKENARRGVMIQGLFRSNFVIFGLPIATALFDSTGATSILIAIIVPIYNVLAVVALEVFRGGRVDFIKILKGVATNPLILGAALGILALVCALRFPTGMESAVRGVAQSATPLALVILGGSFTFKATHGYRRNLLIGVIGKLVVIPAIFIPLSILLGYRDVELATLLAMFASPTAVSSFTMAQQMGGDGELAAQLVVFGSAFSVLTIFLWVFALKQLAFL